MTKTKPQTLTITEAATLLDYSERWISQLIREGKIKAKQRRRRCAVRIDRDHLEQLKEQWGR